MGGTRARTTNDVAALTYRVGSLHEIGTEKLGPARALGFKGIGSRLSTLVAFGSA